MRSRIFMAIVLLLLAFSLGAQEKKSKSEFFKEFYGTYFNSSGIEIPQEAIDVSNLGLQEVILQLEERYDIDIPAEEEAKFNTVEEVAEYVNQFLQNNGSVETVNLSENLESSTEKEIIEPKRKRETWTVNIFGSYGLVEPIGLTGDQGWDGNIFGAEAFNVLENMFTFDAGLMFHPYAITKKEQHKPNSLGLAFDYASFNHWGAHSAFPRDTTATRWGISVLFQQDLTGRNKSWPESGIYIQESVKVSVHDFGFYDDFIQGNGYLSYGLGLTEGLYLSIFDIKLYQTIAYSPALHQAYPSLSILGTAFGTGIIDFEIGLRIGVTIKI